MTHEQLKQAAIDAINALHSDTKVGNLETRDDLCEILDYTKTLIRAIDEDIALAAAE